MSASPYTWPQWRYRFEEALVASAWQHPYMIEEFMEAWERGEDPAVVAEQYMENEREIL